jgi:hypothetical protein
VQVTNDNYDKYRMVWCKLRGVFSDKRMWTKWELMPLMLVGCRGGVLEFVAVYACDYGPPDKSYRCKERLKPRW